jgi:hypothetical protein
MNDTQSGIAPNSTVPTPKVFISYAWTSTQHKEWVRKLATDLQSNGVEVRLDQWHLREGNDANAFMESCVQDASVTKIILVCDPNYVTKANSRKGGAGTEAQIISPELYGSVEQTKVVAVIAQYPEDGTDPVPIFARSRVYIDLSSHDKYGSNFEQLTRWLFDKQVHIPPPLGKPPSFITNSSAITLGTDTFARRAIEAFRNGTNSAQGSITEYLGRVADNLDRFRIPIDLDESKPLDDYIFERIAELAPVRDEILDVLNVAIQYDHAETLAPILKRFMENLLPYQLHRPSDTSFQEGSFDHFHFLIHELFLSTIALLIKHERFATATALLTSVYITPDHPHRSSASRDFSTFIQHTQTFEFRKQRLNLTRKNLRADTLRDRATSQVTFNELMQTDFIIALRTYVSITTERSWPTITGTYFSRNLRTIDLFMRCQSRAYFARVEPMLGVTSFDGFTANLSNVTNQIAERMGLHGKVDVNYLIRLDHMCTAS